MNVALRHKWFTMKLDIAGRSAGGMDDDDLKENMIREPQRRKLSRMGSRSCLNIPGSKKSTARNLV